MPRIIADSDDDGDNPYDDEEVDYRGNPIDSGSSNKQPSPPTLAETTLDATIAVGTVQTTSTGSTERLQQQIRSAERALVAPSPEVVVPAMPLPPGSSAGAGSKRRHTSSASSVPSYPVDESSGRVKRTKTSLKTYSKVHRSSALTGNGDENIRFSDHSATSLPSGSIAADFVNHEPNVMFRDTGSTAVDGFSSQVRMVQEALRSLPESGLVTSLQMPEAIVNSGMVEGSSSFPWTASQVTPAMEKTTAIDATVLGAAAEGEVMQPRESVDAAVMGSIYDNVCGRVTDAPTEQPVPDILKQSLKEPGSPVPTKLAPRSSPRVEIAVARFTAPAAVADEPGRPEKPSKGRRRTSKGDAAADELSSESKLIGLPPEQYIPRPSKRRATQVIEPTDFSVVPEKAVKAKRRKTVDVTQTRGPQQPLEVPEPARASHKASTGLDLSDETALGLPLAHESPGKTAKTTIEVDSQRQGEQPKPAATAKPAPKNAEPPEKKSQEESIFLKPAPKAKSASKVKRSVTTIYEDHVSSSNLNQQQAKRRAAFEEISNDVRPSSQRQRRTILNEDDNEETDELPAAETVKPPGCTLESELPEKRGSSRPPKTAAPTKRPKSAEKVRTEEYTPASRTADKSPRQQGGPKEAAQNDRSEASKATARHDEATTEETAAVSAEQSGASRPAARSTQEPTPSPEKPAPKAATTPAKSSPATHSPLKSNPRAPFRVGLSKRHRIPSLLRTMRPPKR